MPIRHLDPTVSAPPPARPAGAPPSSASGGAGPPYAPWWGRLDVPEGGCARVILGSVTLYVRNLLREWRLYSRHETDPTLDAIEREVGMDVEHPADDARGWMVERFAQTREEGALTLSPRLADRSMVARPEIPISLVGGDEIALFVSTPIWIQFHTADTHRALTDIASLRPSDTWFGPSPREGELCYAMRTRARIDFDLLQKHPVRAITRITLHNRASGPVLIERLSLPVPFLHLYVDRMGLLWTNPVVIERLEAGGPKKTLDGRMRIVSGPPAEAGEGARALADPRVPARSNVFARTLGAMLG